MLHGGRHEGRSYLMYAVMRYGGLLLSTCPYSVAEIAATFHHYYQQQPAADYFDTRELSDVRVSESGALCRHRAPDFILILEDGDV